MTTLVAPVGRFFGGLGDLNDSRRRIDQLEAQNADLARRLRESELTGARAEELRRLKLLAGAGQFGVLPATVTGLGPALGFEWAVTVDAGRRDGIRPDMTVVNADGLVGRVKDVTDSSAVVVLAVDPGSSVGVRLAGGRQLGLASGNGLGPLTFTPIDPQTRVKVGDRLLTGPYGGSTYVAGIPVGEVIAVSGDPGAPAREATVRPYVGLQLAGPGRHPGRRPAHRPPRPAGPGVPDPEPGPEPDREPGPEPDAERDAVRTGTAPGVAVALAVALAVVLQSSVLARLPLPGGPPNLVLVLVVAVGLAGGASAGLATGFAAGLLTDLLSAHPVGLLALCFALAGFVAGLLEADVERSVLLPMVVVGLATLAVGLTYLAVLGLLGRQSADGIGALPGTVLYNVMLTPFVVPLVAVISRRLTLGEALMPDPYPLRLAVLKILVLSLLLTLGARLYYLQVLDQDKLVQTANRQHTREVILPAPRGAVVDDRGRPLVTNRTSLVVSVNRSELQAEPDDGAAVLARLSRLIKVPAAELGRRITPCGKDVPKPCWNGSPYQPVPVLTDTTPDVVLKIAERREDYPGVSADALTLRQYPYGSLAAHSLGYVGPVNQGELDAAEKAGRTDLHLNAQIGRAGLEKTYDADLRGTDGVRYVTVDNRGTVLGVQRETEAEARRHAGDQPGPGRAADRRAGADRADPEAPDSRWTRTARSTRRRAARRW